MLTPAEFFSPNQLIMTLRSLILINFRLKPSKENRRVPFLAKYGVVSESFQR